MRAALKMVGDFWYTAWIEAGQPDLLSNPKSINADFADQETVLPLITPDRVHQH